MRFSGTTPRFWLPNANITLPSTHRDTAAIIGMQRGFSQAMQEALPLGFNERLLHENKQYARWIDNV
jgi:hypothetical protein